VQVRRHVVNGDPRQVAYAVERGRHRDGASELSRSIHVIALGPAEMLMDGSGFRVARFLTATIPLVCEVSLINTLAPKGLPKRALSRYRRLLRKRPFRHHHHCRCLILEMG